MAAVEPFPSNVPSSIYQQIEQYLWESDPEFQGGLTAILGANASPEQAVELTLRARCFYYSRKFNVDVDFDTYKTWREQNHIPEPTGVNGAPALDGSMNPQVNGGPTIQVEAVQAQQPAASQSAEPAAPYPTSFAHIVELITTGQPIPGIKEIPNTVLEGQGTQSARARRKKPWEKDTDEPSTAAV